MLLTPIKVCMVFSKSFKIENRCIFTLISATAVKMNFICQLKQSMATALHKSVLYCIHKPTGPAPS